MTTGSLPGTKASKLVMLKKRAEFLRVRGGGRATAAGFVLEGKVRSTGIDIPSIAGPRFGFTITKKIGNAVLRNRIRRRLKAALTALAPQADPHVDYVVVARLAAAGQDFKALSDDLGKAFARVHAALKKHRHPGPPVG